MWCTDEPLILEEQELLIYRKNYFEPMYKHTCIFEAELYDINICTTTGWDNECDRMCSAGSICGVSRDTREYWDLIHF